MGRSFLTVLIIIMLGMVLGILYFSSTQAEAVEPTPDANSILSATGKVLGASCDAAQAYAFLRSRASGGVKLVPELTGSSGTARGGIDPELACRLQRFLQARPDLRIISGYRSSATQRSLCGNGRKGCAPPGLSCHQYGLAVDITKKDSSTRAQAKQFGLHFPYSGPHIQCQEHVRAGCNPSTPPCAKGGVKIDGGQDPGGTPTSSQGPTGAQSGLSSLLNSLGVGNPSSSNQENGGANLGYSDAFDAAYDPALFGGDLGIGEDDAFFTGDGVPAFEELLGDFGEFGEGSEIREVLGYDDSVDELNSIVPFGTSTRTTISNECTSGVGEKNIYGNIICTRDGAASEEDSSIEDSRTLVGVVSKDTTVVKTIATLMSGILPIRHLIDSEMNNISADGGYVSGNRRVLSSYDAYQPTGFVAYANGERVGIQEEDIVAWMVQNDVIEEGNVTQQVLATVLLGLLRPVLMYIALLLFGTGSYAVDALLDLANNI